MKAFVGYGYNARDSWVESQVFPILRALGFTVVHGKQMQGLELDAEIKLRVEQSDVVVGFLTIREGQGTADFNSHTWVDRELVYADAKGKPIVAIQEEGVRVPQTLLGNRQVIHLIQQDRLACVVELIGALGQKNMRRLKLESDDDELTKSIRKWLREQPQFVVRYRTQNEEQIESDYRNGRLEIVNQGFYLNVVEVPKLGFVEVEGMLGADKKFSSGWVSTDAVAVRID
jgi:hypothetical protein